MLVFPLVEVVWACKEALVLLLHHPARHLPTSPWVLIRQGSRNKSWRTVRAFPNSKSARLFASHLG